jgi:hypothetical protein
LGGLSTDVMSVVKAVVTFQNQSSLLSTISKNFESLPPCVFNSSPYGFLEMCWRLQPSGSLGGDIKNLRQIASELVKFDRVMDMNSHRSYDSYMDFIWDEDVAE